ncbi:NAD(P)-dependent oxidoreductase [Blastococcus sp. TF02-8]|uniref:NAD-dependent epimerase/dehydratase family protein n=1 Tax=Blastococcus sp. TF02-8 TaxID=2250574 RepID=UPI0014133826|nr:NAD(P)-dependent oxidoreductase [Blastococcus sp. TF02-8]
MVTGASGRLGTAIRDVLEAEGKSVRGMDPAPAIYPDAATALSLDICDPTSLPAALHGSTALVHGAALHGAHLVAGTSRSRCWSVNVNGTWNLLQAAAEAGVRRVVFISSTSVYGPGSSSGSARLLDEETSVGPDDVYDCTKLMGERIVNEMGRRCGLEVVSLRLGRFFYADRVDYHLRKLSTGLDVVDAARAVAAVLTCPQLLRPLYCVASDLGLTDEERAQMGVDLKAVVTTAVPELLSKLASMGATLPDRIGKSVATRALRADTGWAPTRDLRWWALTPS